MFIKNLRFEGKKKITNLLVVLRIIVFLRRFSKRNSVTERRGEGSTKRTPLRTIQHTFL